MVFWDAGRSSLRRAVLVFGESINDARAVANFARGLESRLAIADVVPRRDPVIHLKAGDLPNTRRSTVESIVRVVKAEQVRRPVLSVITHQDTDAAEPSHSALADAIEQDLNKAFVPQPIAAVPAWEIESWLMLYPEALARTRGCWRSLDIGSRSVGMIGNAKEQLQRWLRPGRGSKCPDYVESDSVIVTERIESSEFADINRLRRSASISRFTEKLRALTI